MTQPDSHRHLLEDDVYQLLLTSTYCDIIHALIELLYRFEPQEGADHYERARRLCCVLTSAEGLARELRL